MKKYKFFALAFAALTLGACSSDDVVDEQRGPEWNAEGQGYINLAINLPSQPASRANDEYDDGTPEEYDVQDATLILFSNGVVNSAYSMDLNFAGSDPAKDNITTTARITQQINSMTGTIEALVVLNNNGVFTVGEKGALTVGGSTAIGMSLDKLNKAISDNIGTNKNWHNNGFLMSNAVLATAPGGANASTGSAKTLVPIDANKIYKTEAEASNNPAANIYVERAEAKVTVTNNLSGTTTDGSNMAYTIDGWCLDNTNNTSKLVRTVSGFEDWKGYASNAAIALPANKYRFVGSTPVGTNVAGNETYYRVYWGDDYNYSATGAGALTTVGGGQTVADGSLISDIDGNTPQYCFENTTDLATMRENNCTRVVVKASFNGGKPFYTVDGDRATVWTATDAAAEAASRIVADLDFQTWAKANVKDDQTKLLSTDLVVTLSDEAGVAEVEAVTLTSEGEVKLKDGADFTTANAVALGNENIDLKYYANGEAYYSVWVSHFGEDGTPWNGGETQTPSVDNIYHNSDQNYLGRWGMLRNNWYEVNLTGIRSLGEPTVSEATGETIDKLESFISAQINVLSWTKRTQHAGL